MRRHPKLAVALCSILALSLALTAHAAPRNFGANLSGANENPPVETHARGEVTFQLNDDATELTFRLIVANIENVRFAHIHQAPAGQNGPIVVTLYPGPTKTGRTQGVLAEGTITAADLQGALAGMAVADLVALFDGAAAYVNVHTNAHPPGEIRGQVVAR